jgi:DNA-binding HxlR family transcriptional regulator
MADDGAFCPIYGSIDLLQEKWTLHIIRALLQGPLGFNELGRKVGANPSTLAQRLEHLEEVGIVERTVQSVMPPRTSYALSPAGMELHTVIDALACWAAAHLKAPAECATSSTSGSDLLQTTK